MELSESISSKKRAATLGLSAVGLFCAALIFFAILNPDFDYLQDFVSKLGAVGQPFAIWWNLIGFLTVGLLLAAFGFAYGIVIEDKLVGYLLAAFGIGFCVTAIPFDPANDDSAISVAHTLAITLGVATWLLGLARMAYLPSLGRFVYVTANIAAVLVVLPMIGLVAGLWSMPVTHRLVFVVVFGWIVITSLWLLFSREEGPNTG